jgi:hypothetical protein
LNFDFESEGSTWEAMYRQLASFVEKNGHAYLPADQEFEVLKDWLIRQIISKRLLPESQFQRLDRLGVDWETAITKDQRWEMLFLRLKDFHKAFGHCRVPQKWVNDKQLAHWVTVQQRNHANYKIREDRQRRLSEVGFVWDIKALFDSQWEGYYSEMVAFHQRHGHCRVPGKHAKLVSWIERQRIARNNNLLSADRERRLDDINFIWSFKDIKKKSWEDKYRQLRAYKRRHGHSFVPVNCKENKSLGVWVASQRWLEAKGKLGAAKKEKLSKIGFVWSRDTQRELKAVYDTQWEANFKGLKAYQETHGSCQVSLKIDPVLQRWTRWQRQLFYQGRLSAERIDRLNDIRFPWSVQEGYWMRMYETLTLFKNAYGHTRVPIKWDPNPQLAAWVYRVKSGKPELTPQKVELLNGIGFDWTLRAKNVLPWTIMFGQLISFKQKHGHTRVPVKWPENPKLGRWVSRMRYLKERLDLDRISQLESIGFDWGYRLTCGKKPGEQVFHYHNLPVLL